MYFLLFSLFSLAVESIWPLSKINVNIYMLKSTCIPQLSNDVRTYLLYNMMMSNNILNKNNTLALGSTKTFQEYVRTISYGQTDFSSRLFTESSPESLQLSASLNVIPCPVVPNNILERQFLNNLLVFTQRNNISIFQKNYQQNGIFLSFYMNEMFDGQFMIGIGSGYIGSGITFLFNVVPYKVLMHELGHNLMLFHSHYQNDEYGDHSCNMGSGQTYGFFAAPNSYLLGWAMPITTFNASINIHKILNLSIPPISSQRKSFYLINNIFPITVFNTNIANGWSYNNTSLYISYRANTNIYEFPATQFPLNNVYIHVGDGKYSYLQAYIPIGKTYDSIIYNKLYPSYNLLFSIAINIKFININKTNNFANIILEF